MSTLFIDGFAHYDLFTIGQKYDSVTDPNAFIKVGSSYGRLGGSGLRLGSQSTVTKILPVSTTGFIVGFAMRVPSSLINGVVDQFPVARFYYGSSSVIDVSLTRTGLFSFSYQGSTYGNSQATTPVSPDVWNYIEIKVTTGGNGAPPPYHSNQIKVNGVVVSEVGSGYIITWGSNDLRCDRVTFGLSSVYTAYQVDIADLYILQGNGSATGGFIGEKVVKTLLPSSAGTYSSGFTVVGSSAVAAVSEVPPDGDTSYVSCDVSSAAAQAQESFLMSSLPGSPNISSVQVNLSAKPNSTTVVSASIFIAGWGSYTKTGTAQLAISAPYKQYMFQLDQNPHSLAPWTAADVNATEFGVMNK